MDIKAVMHQYTPDGILPDGRVVEYKARMPRETADVAKAIVAVANFGGGLLVYGVREYRNVLELVGVVYERNDFMDLLKRAVWRLTIGVHCNIEEQVVENKTIVVITVNAPVSTTYFSRKESSPERQIEYTFERDDDGKLRIVAKTKMQYKRVFKYMTLEAFITSMYCKSWRFFEPSKWNDKFEQRFYCANYHVAGAKDNTPQLFATCVTREKNSEAAWKVYSHGQGLGMHCLQLELDIVKLRGEIRNSGLSYEERPVSYENEGYITELHKKRNPNSGYKKYFAPFSKASFLNLLALKRKAYAYEQEVRLFVIKKNPSQNRNTYKKAEHQDISIDWKSVIKSVRVDKNCTPAELVSIQQACYYVGIEPKFSGFNPVPGNVSAPAGSTPIDFTAFNIDDMPGTARITIY